MAGLIWRIIAMIPKVFHQIWINDSSPDLPREFERYRDSWIQNHPGWDYRLWNLDNLDFAPRSRNLWNQCQHPAQLADLLRMEVLYEHGGVYIDTDFECLRPIDELVVGIRNFACSEDGRFLQVAILGAEEKSEILNNVIRNFPEKLGVDPVNLETGPAFFTRIVFETGFDNNFTVFPKEYFFPFNYHTKDRGGVDLSGAYAIHHYADSWQTPVPYWRRLVSGIVRRLRPGR